MRSASPLPRLASCLRICFAALSVNVIAMIVSSSICVGRSK
jgi:hypothetical protein